MITRRDPPETSARLMYGHPSAKIIMGSRYERLIVKCETHHGGDYAGLLEDLAKGSEERLAPSVFEPIDSAIEIMRVLVETQTYLLTNRVMNNGVRVQTVQELRSVYRLFERSDNRKGHNQRSRGA